MSPREGFGRELERAARRLGLAGSRGEALWALVIGASLGLPGCDTQAFCYEGCSSADAQDAGSDGPTGPGPSGSDHRDPELDSGWDFETSVRHDADDPGPTQDTELCNGEDDDGNGEIDDGIDFEDPRHCGNCETNCLLGEGQYIPSCKPPKPANGTKAGTCRYDCSQDWYDLDPEVPGCEYYCPWNPTGENTEDPGGDDSCDRDDDCDGQEDEDVERCSDRDNCGKCGRKCVTPNARATCVSTAAEDESCNTTNTHCEVAECDAGWFDIDGSPDNGCEYQCEPTADGAEICDGLDNDCDQLIDNADPDLEAGESQLGDACTGGEYGICADAAHAGIRKCIGGQLTCCDTGSNALEGTNPNFPATGARNGICGANLEVLCEEGEVCRPGDLDELCNGADDDCNGVVDDSPTDVGQDCGAAAVGNCVLGVGQCLDGVLECVGAIGPAEELCNGQDDDCDGVIDGTLPEGEPEPCNDQTDCDADELCLASATGTVCVLPPSDATGPCSEPPAPPDGATSGCLAGRFECAGGALRCVGSVTSVPAAQDECGVDANCDGVLDTQPDLDTDPLHCGACGHSCSGQGALADWACVDGACQQSCRPGYIECQATDGVACETPCVRTADSEICNGLDDDCDCLVDSDDPDLSVPTPAQVCGVASTASDPNCTSAVTVRCDGGAWECAFPSGFCSGAAPDYCIGAPDPCDGADNNCNGIPDEAYRRPLAAGNALGDACGDGVGACRREGTYRCNADHTGLECSATPAEPGIEECNGLDDDCDGTTDEFFLDEAADDGSYVRPRVAAIGQTWVFAYEASRPNADDSDSGSGNGYHVSAPTGETLDRTMACSEPNRVPWTNVTPREVEQICDAIGGRVCRTGDWVDACAAGSACDFAYASSCGSYADYTEGPFCNLAGFDFAAGSGDQDGLLPTQSSQLSGCYADWTTPLFDLTGNAREITRCQPDRAVCPDAATCAVACCSGTSTSVNGPTGATRLCGELSSSRRLSGQLCSEASQCCNYDDVCSANGTCSAGACGGCRALGVACTQTSECCSADCVDGVCGGPMTLPRAVYPLMGGAYPTVDEDGATCTFDFFKVEPSFKLFDTGFRCCFDENPAP